MSKESSSSSPATTSGGSNTTDHDHNTITDHDIDISSNNDGNNNKEFFPSHLKNKTQLSPFIRYGMLFLILTVLGVYIPSDIGSGISFDATLKPATFDVHIITVSVFSSVTELLKAKSYVLAILIILMSIIWPYVKVLCSLYLWMVPFGGLGTKSCHRRELLASILDVLGKWSLLDIFILIVMMGSLKIDTAPAVLGLDLGELLDLVGIRLVTWLTPKWGLYGFIAASLLCFIVEDSIVYYQREVIYPRSTTKTTSANKTNNDDNDDFENDEEGMIVSQNNQIDTDAQVIKLTSRMGWKGLKAYALTLLPILTCVLMLLIGFFLEIVQFKYTDQITGTRTVRLSFYDIGTTIATAPLPTERNGGEIFIQILYYFLGIVMPIVNLASLLILFLRPMNLASLRTMMFVCEVTFAWSCAGPLLVALVASVDQLPKFVNTLIDESCDGCFEVKGEIMTGIVVLCAVGVIGHMSLFIYGSRKVHGVVFS